MVKLATNKKPRQLCSAGVLSNRFLLPPSSKRFLFLGGCNYWAKYYQLCVVLANSKAPPKTIGVYQKFGYPPKRAFTLSQFAFHSVSDFEPIISSITSFSSIVKIRLKLTAHAAPVVAWQVARCGRG